MSGFYGFALCTSGLCSILATIAALSGLSTLSAQTSDIISSRISREGEEDKEKMSDALAGVSVRNLNMANTYRAVAAFMSALAIFCVYAVSTDLESINILAVRVFCGIIVGACSAFVLTGMLISSVNITSRVALRDMGRSDDETGTTSSLRGSLFPAIIAVLLPTIVGLFFGPASLAGFLEAIIVTGCFIVNASNNSGRYLENTAIQSLSSVKSMFNALNNYRNLHDGMISDSEQISRVKGTTVKEAFEFIDKNIRDMMPALEHIADVEYSFNKPEWIDPERFIEGYITKKGNGWLNFKPSVTWDKGHNQAKADLKDPSTGRLILKKGDAVDMLLFPTDALERVFNNIVSNAQAHGFADSTRKDYELRFSWHTDGIALIVEIENNGTAIPSDRDTTSLLEYGVSSALHQNGHNGIGCNEIDDIMRRYDGKVEIVSSPEKKFTVKYVLTFTRSNIVKYI